jgi:hypothetical protein
MNNANQRIGISRNQKDADKYSPPTMDITTQITNDESSTSIDEFDRMRVISEYGW